MRSPIRGLALPMALAAFVAGLALAAPGQAQEEPVQQVSILVGDLWFCDASFQSGVCETTITAGDTVLWDFSSSQLPHDAAECGGSCDDPTSSPLWESGIIDDGSSFQFTFAQPGSYLYFCTIHPVEMRGRLVVQPRPVETATPAEPPEPPDGGPEPAPEEDGPPPVVVPATGLERQQGMPWVWWGLAALVGMGAAFAGAGAIAYRRAR